MQNYLLPDLTHTNLELMGTVFISGGAEFTWRHLREARLHPEHRWGHLLLAGIEYLPLIGHVAVMVEGVAVRRLRLEPPDFTNSPWIFRGTQRGCNGSVNRARAQEVFNKIFSLRETGIHFNAQKIVSTLVGGTCSAMALELADRCLSLTTVNDAHQVFLREIRQMGEEFKGSSEEMRSRQAAFNTIEVINHDVDYTRNKMQSLCHFHGLKIAAASEEMDINTRESLEGEVRNYPRGIYAVRIIKPVDNEKMEAYGHTMIYIKYPNVELLYDSNFGSANLHPKLIEDGTLISYLKYYSYWFGVNRARFYLLVKN